MLFLRKKSILIVWMLLCLLGCSVETEELDTESFITFTWDNQPFDNGKGSVTETMEGVIVTVTSPLSTHNHSVGFMDIIDQDGNSKDNVIVSYHPETSIRFTFSQPIILKSLIAMSGENKAITFTLTPIEAGNSTIVQELIPGKNVAAAKVEFNWTEITSFTVTATPNLFGFDNMIIVNPISQ